MEKLKSQKGVTMISLMLYVAAFAAITLAVGSITTFFYSNVHVLDDSIGTSSEYNKFNLYLLNECKKPGATIYAIRGKNNNGEIKDIGNLRNALPEGADISEETDPSESEGTIETEDLTKLDFITFKSDSGDENSFIYDENRQALYYNSIKLCQDVEEFQLNLDKSTGKDVLSVLININGTAFQTKYVVGL